MAVTHSTSCQCPGCKKKKYMRDWARANYPRIAERQREAQKRSRQNVGPRARGMIAGARNRAKVAGIPFSLTKEWLQERIEAGKCEATGLPFELATYAHGTRFSPWSPSIDRIEPDGPYSPGNCRVVIWMFNLARNKWTDADVLRMATALMERDRGK